MSIPLFFPSAACVGAASYLDLAYLDATVRATQRWLQKLPLPAGTGFQPGVASSDRIAGRR